MTKNIADIDENMAVPVVTEEGFDWYSADNPDFALEGAYWHKPGDRLRRLQTLDKLKTLPANVDILAWHTAGVQLRFKTDAREIRLKYKVRQIEPSGAMSMIGSTGFDIYTGSGYNKINAQSFLLPHYTKEDYLGPVYSREKGGTMTEFTLNFPLYSGVEEFAIGVTEGAKIKPPTPWPDPRPIVVYGTSIQQGGCASRPGMCHTNILSRKLNRPFLNLAFSGSGKGEPVMAEILASIEEPAMYVLDYDANAGVEGLQTTLTTFIDILRKAHPKTQILMVSRTLFSEEVHKYPFEYDPVRIELTKIHVQELERRRNTGDRNIHFLDGTTLYGSEPLECMVDGIHATDLGFFEIAKHMAPVISRILDQQR